VGDNVGDCAGMAADLFESYQVTLAASIILGAATYGASARGVMFPLMIMGIGVVVAVVGILSVAPRTEDEPGMRAINRGFFLSAALSAVAVLLLSVTYMKSARPFIAVLIGLALAAVIEVLTEHYTSMRRRPVKDIAEASLTGPATNILAGFSEGLESSVWSILAIGAAIIGCFYLGHDLSEQLFFVSLAGIGMLSVVGVIVSMDTYGPVSDNAQGIAEMSGDVSGAGADILTNLDAIGNSTKAITKGIAIATAVLAATSLFGAFQDAANLTSIRVNVPIVLVGLLFGGSVAFLFSSFAIRAVGRTASQVVMEVRTQFREHPGIMDYTEKPDYSAVVDIVTKSSIRELATPATLAVMAPIIVGFLLKAEALGAFLAGAILTGQLMAVMLSNAGGAWDNAKKLVEDGAYGGKGSETHKATVIGDTVGDPFKDTAGPALNPMIKVMNLVALLVVPVVVTVSGSSAGDVAVRLIVGGGATLLLGAVIWMGKSRKPEGARAAPTREAA
jgi:K(+)-stimulated pyrophosphate-energized sodium pump